MKKIIYVAVSVLCILSLVTGCTNLNQTPSPSPTQAPPTQQASTAPSVAPSPTSDMAASQDLTVCVASDPQTMDPGLSSSVDGAIMLSNCFSGLYQYAYDSSGKLVTVADDAQSVVTPTPLSDGSGKYQYVLTLKQGLKWSDGQPLKASDFTYAWNRAVDPATASDYQYIFQPIDGYDATTPKLNVTADDAAGTITIVTTSLCSYFNQLLAFPEFFPVRKDIIDANGANWATSPSTYISNGAFRMKSWTVGDKIVFEKNPNYWDAADVNLNTLTFALSDDDNAIYANYSNGTYQFTTAIPVDQIPTLKNDPTRMNKDFFIGDYLGTYYLEFNVNMSFKPGLKAPSSDASAWTGWSEKQNEDVRHALALLINRDYIVNQVTQGGQAPAVGFVPPGMSDGNGTDFRTKAGDWWSVDPNQQDANTQQALTLLKQYYNFDATTGKFTNFPTFVYSVNPTTGHLAIAAAIKDMWDKYGIECSVDQRTWAVIQTALTNGDFTVARLGWIADYNDASDFLNLYETASGNNHPQFGKKGIISAGNNFGTNNDQPWSTFDDLFTQAAKAPDTQTYANLMYQAETMLKDTWAVAPIYYYTNPYLKSPNLQGMVYTPLGTVLFKTAYFSTK